MENGGLTTTLTEGGIGHDAFREGVAEAIKPDNPAQAQQQPKATEAPKPPKEKIEFIDVTALSQEDKNVIEVDWGASERGESGKLFDGPVKPVPDQPIGGGGDPGIGGGSSGGTFNKEDFRVSVKILVAVIDFAMSSLLRWIAKAEKVSHYTADKEAKKNLEDSIIEILAENKAKMPAWLVILFAFLAAYGFQVMGAIADRKRNAEDQERKANLELANEEKARQQEAENKRRTDEAKKKAEDEKRRQQEETKKRGEELVDNNFQTPEVVVETPPVQYTTVTDVILPDGLILKPDGKKYRQYANGEIREARFDPKTNKEIRRGKPPRYNGKNN